MVFGTEVNATDSEYLISGGIASGSILRGGNSQYSYAFENVFAGGQAFGSIVEEDGREDVSAGGTATNVTVEAYGLETVYAGGFANGTRLQGGTELVQSGGTANGIELGYGSTATLNAGATLNGDITFTGSYALLSIGDTTMPTGVIGGFDAGGFDFGLR